MTGKERRRAYSPVITLKINKALAAKHRLVGDLHCKKLPYVLPPEAGQQFVVPSGRQVQILSRARSTNDKRTLALTDACLFSFLVVPLSRGMTDSEGAKRPKNHRDSLPSVQNDSQTSFAKGLDSSL